MKNFVFTIESEKVRKVGGCNISGKIYRIKNNFPVYVNDYYYCTSSYKGEIHEIFGVIADSGQLTRKEILSSMNHKDRGERYKGNRKKINGHDLYFDFREAEKVGIKIHKI